MIRHPRALGLAAGGAALAAIFVAPVAASADTVQSPIGTVTAEQYLGVYCDDLGAHVRVTVAGGLPGTSYAATGIGVFSGTSTFVTDGTGAGFTDLHNVWVHPEGGVTDGVGVTQVTVGAGSTVITVPAAINCPGQKGG
ncbi:hypothetical protein GCM10010435_22920 [Winogradskya consettensis]|uniref:Secreted protein n=1 Tax=Winogradskya consettensis TaxID=113560 RepID=A0A919VWV3_9ACTN|nr:hypothetical protein [Actinoplanes consettensis]GIM83360.1 hypothetical protein Aco04nite_86150 [Actinoplanes consettensis]